MIISKTELQFIIVIIVAFSRIELNSLADIKAMLSDQFNGRKSFSIKFDQSCDRSADW